MFELGQNLASYMILHGVAESAIYNNTGKKKFGN